MWLIGGLGNPGPKYQATRHNVGFDFIDEFANKHRFGPSREWKNAEFWKGEVAGIEALLAKPLTFMNLSGTSIGAIATFYKIPPDRVIIVHDELDFEPGVVRLKSGGGFGGHNGIQSVASAISREFIRVRIGIGKPRSAASGADYVLSRFDRDSRIAVDTAIVQAMESVEDIISHGMQAAMNRANRKPQ